MIIIAVSSPHTVRRIVATRVLLTGSIITSGPTGPFTAGINRLWPVLENRPATSFSAPVTMTWTKACSYLSAGFEFRRQWSAGSRRSLPDHCLAGLFQAAIWLRRAQLEVAVRRRSIVAARPLFRNLFGSCCRLANIVFTPLWVYSAVALILAYLAMGAGFSAVPSAWTIDTSRKHDIKIRTNEAPEISGDNRWIELRRGTFGSTRLCS